ncbi:MAG: hypothetical protein M3R04_07295 [bacterium]|nr:hypothetical protein [bacterium]
MSYSKDWYKSKAIWLGIIAALYSIVNLVGVELPEQLGQAKVEEFLGLLFGLLVILFRWNADSVITQSSKTPNA